MPVQAAQVVASLGSTASQIVDAKKRRDIEMAISRLSTDEQIKLNQKIARAQSLNERLNILAQEVTKIQIEQAKEQSKKQTRNAIFIVGGSVIVLVAVYLLTRNKA
jgi:uncharacterized small protein (DUF1192 family)